VIDVLVSMPVAEFLRRLAVDRPGLSVVAGVTGVALEEPLPRAVAHELTTLPCLVLTTVDDPVADAVVSAGGLDVIRDMGARCPQALVSTALLLRGVGNRTLAESLVAESTTYSLLQGGAEFRDWRNSRSPKPVIVPSASDPAVIVEREDDRLVIELNRPDRRNAYSRLMRDQLAEALDIAIIDDSITRVVVRGRGTNFSSGGDLDEFGSFTTPVDSHLSRLTSSVAWQLATLRGRLGTNLACEVHGANFGAGVELSAFCGHVVAHPESTFCLPEVTLGLTPGAGGTASIPARIGRQRAALMAFTAMSVDALTALEWGLIDEIDETMPSFPT